MQCRGRRVAEMLLRGVLLIGAMVAAWAVYNAIAADAAYANDRPCPSVIGELLDTVSGVDAVLPPSSLPTQEQTTIWPLAPARSDDARSAEAEQATMAEPGQRAGQPEPVRPAMSARAGTPSTPSASVRRAVGETTGGLVTPVVTLVEPVTRPAVDTVAPAVGEVTDTGLLAPVVADVVSVAQPIVGAVRPVLDPVLDAARPMVGPLVDVVVPTGEPVDLGPGPASDAHGVISMDASPRPAPTSGQMLAPPGVHEAFDLHGPGRWVAAAHRCAGGDRAGDAAVGADGLAPIDVISPVPGQQGSTTGAGASGAGGGAVVDACARPWAPELGAQASHWPPRGKLTGRWPAPGAAPV